MDDDLSDEERSDQVRNVLFKALGVLVVIGVLIFLGTTIMVHALGLNDDSSAGPVGGQPAAPPKALPSTALPVPETVRRAQRRALAPPTQRPPTPASAETSS